MRNLHLRKQTFSQARQASGTHQSNGAWPPLTTDLPDDAAGVFGIAGEAEDIRGHLLGFDQLMALVGSGEISNAPTLLTAYWLAQRRKDLRET